MNARLIAFTLALLFLPPIALLLAGREWITPPVLTGPAWLPALASWGITALFLWLLDTLTYRRQRFSLLRSQRHYLLWCGIAGLLLGMLLGWLNLFTTAWLVPVSAGASLLLAALTCMLLLPGVLIVRQWLAGLGGLVKLSTRGFPLPSPTAETLARLLLAAALAGLFAGPVWPAVAGWPFWLAPLLLLAALQHLWHESTIFAGLPRGDWSRVLLGALAGILAGSLALTCYRVLGGALQLAAGYLNLLAGLSLFGLLSLQLADIVAEHWRGKPRYQPVQKKPFPIPVVARKDP